MRAGEKRSNYYKGKKAGDRILKSLFLGINTTMIVPH